MYSFHDKWDSIVGIVLLEFHSLVNTERALRLEAITSMMLNAIDEPELALTSLVCN